MVPSLVTRENPPAPAEARTIRPGIAVSLLVHGLVAFFLIYQMNALPPEAPLPIVPVDIVRLAQQAAAPPIAQSAAGSPQRTASLRPRPPPAAPVAPRPAAPAIPNPLAEAPPKEAPPQDALETKLQALARLRAPDTDPRLANGTSALTSLGLGQSGRQGFGARYSVKDLIRAQVERRWNLDTATLGARSFSIAIHVVLAPDGTVTTAEIVDQKRYVTDADYRSIALSARNAVLLSSPFTLPEDHDGVTDVTLDLDPRATLR